MGLIRRTLNIGSLGIVKAHSKKQRVARAHLASAERVERFEFARFEYETPELEAALHDCADVGVPKKHVERVRGFFEKGIISPKEYVQALDELVAIERRKQAARRDDGLAS